MDKYNKSGKSASTSRGGSSFSRAGSSGRSSTGASASSRTRSSSNRGSSTGFSSGSRSGSSTGSGSTFNGPRSRFSAPSSGSRGSSSGYGNRGGASTGSRGGFSSRGSFGGNRGGNGGGRGKTKMRGEFIDTAKFIYKPTADDLKVKTHEIKHTFADFGFSQMTNANLARRGYITPSPIQDQSIPVTMAGKDIIGLARTGSGKTAAFLLPLIQKAEQNPDTQVLILAPTRELATQINTELRDFTQGMRIFSTVCVGGLPIYRQIQDLKRKNHFIIATPGRLKDLADRGVVKYNQISAVVLDEVDHMLDMGFVDDITAILEQLPKNRQSFFFSATMPPRIKSLMDRFLQNPVVIEIESTGSSAKTVHQDVIRVTDRSKKLPKLLEILEEAETERTLIFVETKAGVEKLADELEFHGYSVGYIHGDKVQRQRQRTLDDFKAGKTKVMIATDVAARGIDIKDVTHVINYTIPQTHNDYIHRIGRTGRAGKTGKAFTFV